MSNDRSHKTYPLPLEIVLTIDLKTSLYLVILSIVCIVAPFFFNFEAIRNSGIGTLIIIYVILPLIGILMIIAPFYQNLFKKVRAIITSENITYIHTLGKRTLTWNEISEIKTYTRQNSTFLGFVTNENAENKKNFFYEFFSPGAASYERYSMGIPMDQVNSLDPDRVINTIIDTHKAYTKKPGGKK